MNDYKCMKKNEKFKTIFWSVCFLFAANIYTMHASPSVTDDVVADTKMQQQTFTVSGTVTSSDGEPLIGVSVLVPGNAQLGTITDSNGKFSILLPNQSASLQFSYLGYTTQVVKVNGKKDVNVVLQEETKALEDVVVVAYAKQKKETVTGSISSITTKDLLQSPQANISNALAGRLPGLLSVQRSGLPGADASTIRIRGIGSFASAPAGYTGPDPQDPLVMVDGVETDNYNNIDPSEIASFSILKDASSTAVYGVRGANGVILITTRRGELGKPRISASTNVGVTDFPYMRKSMNSYDYATSYNLAQSYDAYVTGTTYVPKYTADVIAKYQDHSDPVFYPDMDWFSYMLKNYSYQTQSNFNVSGGTDRVKYFASLGYLTQDGMFNTSVYDPGYDYQARYRRYNLRSNFDINISKNLSASFDLSTQIGQFHGLNYDIGGLMTSLTQALPMASPGVIDNKVIVIPTSPGVPPIALFNKGWNTTSENNVDGSIRLNYKMDYLLKGLSLRGAVSYKTYYTDDKSYNKQGLTYNAIRTDSGETIFIPPSGLDPLQIGWGLNNKTARIYLEGGIEYAHKFGDHNVTGLLLYNQSKDFDPTLLYNIPHGVQGLVGRVTYNFKNRYLAEYNLGYNGTENFAPGRRFGFFPAYSLGWAASEESFFPKNEWVTFLKIRGSYGTVGNDKLGGDAITQRFLYLPSSYTFESNAYFFGPQANVQGGSLDNWTPPGGSTGALEGKLGNDQLVWEKSVKKNIGVDMKLWKDHISVVFDVFREDRDNILSNKNTVPANIIGVTLPAYNLGRMQNGGYEGEITFNDSYNGINYFVKANYTYAHNVIKYMDELRNYPYYYQTGHPYGQFFGYVCDGYFTSWSEVNDASRPDYSAVAGTNQLQPGDLKYKDINGDGKIDNNDQVPIGYSNFPEIMYGVSFGAEWKGFDFSVLFQGADHVSTTPSRSIRQGFWQNTGANEELLESWSLDRFQQNLPIKFPRLAADYGGSNYVSSTFWLENARYVRLKNAEVGYTFRQYILKKAGISSVRLYVNGSNLLTWCNLFQGEDPEFANDNYTSDPYPVTRIFNLGLNINF